MDPQVLLLWKSILHFTPQKKIEDAEGVVVNTLVMMLRIATALNPRPQQIGLALVINISLCQNLR